MAERTDEERVAAVESMYRIRAVESPPDADGARTIWHRGLKGAELVTEVDATGRVTRQELCLFDEVVVWSGEGLKTGTSTALPSRRPKASDGLTWDVEQGAERLSRMVKALQQYRGSDRFIHHLRDMLGVTDGAPPPSARGPITRSSPAVLEDALLEAEARRARDLAARRRSQWGLAAAVVGGLVALGGLAMLWRTFGS